MTPPLSPAFEEAQVLLKQVPLPPDTGARLAELERQVAPSERELFSELWEAFYVAGGIPDEGR